MSQLRETQAKRGESRKLLLLTTHPLCGWICRESNRGNLGRLSQLANKTQKRARRHENHVCVITTWKPTTTAQKSCRSTICYSAKDTRIFCFTTEGEHDANGNATTDAHDTRGHARTGRRGHGCQPHNDRRRQSLQQRRLRRKQEKQLGTTQSSKPWEETD